MSTPSFAPRPTPTMMDMGVAKPRAQGQATISTLTATTRACARRGVGPTRIQIRNASTAMPMTTGTKTAETLSTRDWMGARER